MATIDTTEVFGRGENASFDYAVRGLNEVSNYLFIDFILIALFLIVLFMLRNYELRDGLLASTAIVWLFSLVMWISEFTDFSRVVICFCGIIVALGMSYFKD